MARQCASGRLLRPGPSPAQTGSGNMTMAPCPLPSPKTPRVPELSSPGQWRRRSHPWTPTRWTGPRAGRCRNPPAPSPLGWPWCQLLVQVSKEGSSWLSSWAESFPAHRRPSPRTPQIPGPLPPFACSPSAPSAAVLLPDQTIISDDRFPGSARRHDSLTGSTVPGVPCCSPYGFRCASKNARMRRRASRADPSW